MVHQLSAPEVWLERYGNVLYRFALARVRDGYVAEDLVQETLLAALKAKDNYAGKAAEQTWLVGILRHKIVDHYRKQASDKTQAFDETMLPNLDNGLFDSDGAWEASAVSSWSKPEQLLEQTQFVAAMQTCLDRLPERMAQLFVLREVEGLDSEDICQMLNISTLNNFWVIMSRTRALLRQCLHQQGFTRD
ncbi:MAG: sigma-70 family RNA polymerase sigma factor [Methylococcales bacterium]|nr:sigma-70 family RNA polymerase sigma factor [Methylococcales bacterium]